MKKIILIVATLSAFATAAFMIFINNMPNVFDWELDDE